MATTKPTPIDPERERQLLLKGRIRTIGLMPDCSNYTYLAEVRDGHDLTLAVYKPARGEMPLDDFPEGTLGKREVGAYLISEALGWEIVPFTVYRNEAPLGPGSLQQFVVADLSQHYFTLMPERASDFRTMAAFDCIVNNADRKAGHCLIDESGHIWGVDNGLTFHPLPKLRTVIWEFGGDPIPPELRAAAGRLSDQISRGEQWVGRLRSLISAGEIRSLQQRARRVAEQGVYPVAQSRWAYPWPLV
jgi:uncharacterized repeat protein (TIGR03843 family)